MACKIHIMNKIYTAIKIVGGLARMSELLSTPGRAVTAQAVYNWRVRGSVPADFCPAIERLTKGQVRCEELRPDVDWADRVYKPKRKVRS